MNADVIVVGAGPTGLMLAGELSLAGVRPLVLERQPILRDEPKANAFVGEITQLLRFRGLLERFEAAAAPRYAMHGYPFGNVYLDFTGLDDPPPRGLQLPQPQLERLLDERARELGADVRRGHELVGLTQNDAGVTVVANGPHGSYTATASYIVGCDGPRSRVRELAAIPFPGTTYPEVYRLGQFTVPDSLIAFENGDLDIPGYGRLHPGFTQTDRGVFAYSGIRFMPGLMGFQTTEEERNAVEDDGPMSMTEFRNSVRRVLGADLPLGEVKRLTRYRLHARQAERYREKRVLLAGDAAHQFPATGIGLNVGMLDAVNAAWKLAAQIQGWAPEGLLDTYHVERHFAGARGMLQTQAQVALRRGKDPAAQALRHVFQELLRDEQPLRRLGALIAGTDICYPIPNPNQHTLTGAFAPDLTLAGDEATFRVSDLTHAGRPVLLDLAGRQDLREIARGWQHRVDVHCAGADRPPAEAILIRPDAHVAWAATGDEPAEDAALSLREALTRWFGSPEGSGDSVARRDRDCCRCSACTSAAERRL